MKSTYADGSGPIEPVIHANRQGAAARALAEAEQRRMEEQSRPTTTPPERDGRGGLDPVRYGDWEVRGLASDF